MVQSYLALLPAGCAVAMEAYGGAHHGGVWRRHRVVLMSPQFVAPYVKGNKNDVNDAVRPTPAQVWKVQKREASDRLRSASVASPLGDAPDHAAARRGRQWTRAASTSQSEP